MMTRITKLVGLSSILLIWLTGCHSGPIDYPRTYSEVIVETEDTHWGREVAAWQQSHPGVSGFYPLIQGIDGLGARLRLMDKAERTIDAQYFLMKSDTAGLIVSGKLLEAADRGVRVRFLLDDLYTTVDDHILLLLDQHPNIEMRLFNPISRKGRHWLNFAGDFKRANRRMHNKSLTVDNQISVVGGRNIAEEYFELQSGTVFRDFDVLALGTVAGEIAKTFDRYWNHKLSVPMEAFVSDNMQLDLEEARARVSEEKRKIANSAYARAVGSSLIQDLMAERIPLFPARAEVITDDPDKLLNKVAPDQKVLATRMAEVVANAQSEVIVITPYFIPRKSGVEFWRSLTERGVRVIILTNSLAATNHVPVHAAYARYRHRMIRAGVELFEMRVDATAAPQKHDDKHFDSVTLHSKIIMVDRRTTFVGSLNLDPRSIDINSEMGVLVDSPAMSKRLAEPFMAQIPHVAYQVIRNKKGRLRWHAMVDGQEVVEKAEPQAGYWRRFKAFMSRGIPENQL
jgi:putative cardiolipin synthase